MYRDICLTNSDALTRWLNEYIAALSKFRDRIAARDSSLDQTFVTVGAIRPYRHRW